MVQYIGCPGKLVGHVPWSSYATVKSVLASSIYTYQNKVPVTKLYADETTKEATTIQYIKGCLV